MTRVLVMTNNNGGVGKSTSATNVAFGLVRVLRQASVSNPRVLLIDTDRVGTEPTEPEPDRVESFVRSGLVTGAELFAAYEKAREADRAEDFLAALKERNEKATEVLTAWIIGKQIYATVYIPKCL